MSSSITFLGTGTSQGVPVLGCHCHVCISADKRDDRLRTSILISDGTTNVVVDAGPDFRAQLLREKVDHGDALVITHEHNDHVAGLDDIRPYNFKSKKSMRVYTLPRVAEELRSRFAYIFDKSDYPGKPVIELIVVEPPEQIRIGAFELKTFVVQHGNLPVLGFRIGGFTYITDANSIPTQTMECIDNTETLVLNALHHKPHHSHFNLEEAVAESEKIGATKTYLTHISHHMGLAAEVEKSLPKGVHLAYDGLVLNV